MRARAVVLGGFALTLVACASVLGIEDPIVDLEGGPPDASGVGDAPTDTTGGDINAPDGGDAAQTDAPTTDAPMTDGGGADSSTDADAGCSRIVDEVNGFFVDQTAGMDSATCGPRLTPCKAIQKGLDRAQTAAKTFVYVAQGTYTESIALHPGISLQGGWDVTGTTWTATCAVGAVTITAPNTSNVTVTAAALGAGAATLDTLRIRSKPANMVAAGQSIYGVFASGNTTTLVLNDVDISVVQAGDGTPGSAGVDGGNASGTNCPPAGAGGTPANGTPGAAADAGSFAAGGYAAASAGSGNPGLPGDHGPAGNLGTCVNCVSCGGALCTAGANGTSCGQQGAVGCGGAPGTGGGAGGGGGSSVALYVFDANVTLTSSALTAGNGGAGGIGGASGAGGAGSRGSTGMAGNTCGTACNGNVLMCAANAFGAGAGGAGSLGGGGSAGGAGGGGAGGWSCGYVKAGAATVTLDLATSTAITNMSGGTGAGGAPMGKGQAKCP